jgi:hypothetical protein
MDIHMTQRSIFGGMTPLVIIKAGSSVVVEGWDSDQIVAESSTRGGLKVETHSEAEIARARLAAGDLVLFDVRLKRPAGLDKNKPGEAVEVQIGGEGRVRVPRGSRVKVYAGKNAQVSDIQGTVAVYTGGGASVRNVRSLTHISSGGAIDLECETIEGGDVKFEAGRDLRCYVRGLTSARLLVSDLGGYWEGLMGSGGIILRLKAGGDVILVTDQKVEAAPPDFILGQIERPVPASGAA